MLKNIGYASLLAAISVLSLSTFARAADAALPAGMQKVTAVEGITEYRLANGLRVLLFPDLSKQTATVNITYLVGSRHESYGETGMAHLLEHMLFKGTPQHPNIPKELTERGTRPNGTTSFDRTNYFETFAATEDNLRWALELEADRMVNSFVARKDLDTEMTVVRNEFEMGENNPATVLQQRVMSTAYLWHNYGNSPIGSRADVENVPIERLQNFYRTWYQPDNAVLMVAGKFDPAKVLSMVSEFFGPIPRPKRVLPTFYTVEPAQDGERSVILRRVSDTQFVMAAYHIPSASHPDAAALDLLTTLLGDEPTGRLYKSLVETKQAAGVFAYTRLQYDPGVIVVGAQVRKDASLDAARDSLVKAMDNLANTPITREELERARAQELNQIELSLNNSEHIGLMLSDWISMGDWRMFFLHRDQMRAVKVEDLNRVTTTYLSPVNRTLGLAYSTDTPSRVDIPAGVDIASLVRDYKGDTSKSEGEVFDPSPANIDARTQRSQLPGSLRLALLPKKTRGGSVHVNLTLRTGDLQSLTGRRATASLAGAMLMRGTTARTRTQLNDEFDRLKSRVSVSSTATATTATAETTRENLPAVLTLLAEVLQKPAFTPAEFELAKQERLADLEEQSKEPTVLAQNALLRRIAPYETSDIRSYLTTEQMAAETRATTLEQARDFHRQFVGAAVGELAVVGDFDSKAIAALTAKLFQNWKSRKPFTRVPRLYFDVAAGNETVLTPDKANAFIMAGINLKLRDDDADYPAIALTNYLLGGGFLNSRLAMRLRQQDGFSYDAGSQLQVSSLDTTGTLFCYAIFAPQNAARVEAGLREELQRLIKDGFTAAELEAAKPGWLQSRQVSRAQDNELTRTLSNSLFLKRTLAWDAALEQKVTALTADEVNAALRRHLSLDKLTVVKAGDFNKKQP